MSPRLIDREPGEKWTVLGVGPFGVGKSINLLSLAKYGEVWVPDFDGRLDSVIEFYRYNYRDILKNIHYDTFGPRNYLDFCKKFEALQDPNSYYGVLLDSITSLSVTTINYSMLAAGQNVKLSRDQKGLPIPDWPDFNAEASQFSLILDIGKSIKPHFMATAHPLTRTKLEVGENNKIKGARTYESLVSAGVKGIELVPNYFNEIWRFGTEVEYSSSGIKRSRFIKTQPEFDGDLAKTSCGLPDKFDFTGKLLFDAIKEFNDKKKESIIEKT